MAYDPTTWNHGDLITGGKLNKIEKELTHVADNATYGFGGAQLSSDGLTPFSYINAGDPMPANPQKGDTVFLKDGNDFLIYSYNGEDWVLKIDPDLSNRIEETIKTASDNTDKAIADNNTQINETINQVAKSQADLAIKDGDFNNKAQAMADEALANAKANTATVAQETLNTANENLDAAKQSLTTDLQKEVSDRTTAVATLDSKAQGYADSAKQDAIAAATTADGTINKKIDETASSITSTVSQNKMDAEGKITTAQSTATQALNGLSSKVDTATYNAKTGQLSTDVTNVTQTANQAKTDIASIKQTDITQDARMTTIEADANGTKTTVCNLQKTQNTQSGSISTLQQRADGFDATVDTINGATAKAQLTAELARTELTNYKTDADGRISKAQSDVTQTAALVATKVSQSDYDKKTGQLSTDVSNAQQTANSAVTTIGSYKTSNDNRVSAAESKISQNADAITLRATKSDLDVAKSDYTAQIAQVKVDAQAVTTTVSQIQTTVNKLNQNNLVNNSQLNPDYSGWHVGSPWGKSITGEIWNNGVESSSGAMWVWHDQSKTGEWIYSDPINILQGLTLSASIMAAMPTPPSSGSPLALYVRTYDANKTVVDSWGLSITYSMVNGTFKKFNLDNKVASSGAKYASVVFGWNVAGQISFGKPMLVFGATTGDYVAGPYNNNDKVSSLQVSLDGITSTVSKTTSDVSALTSRVQTAEGTLSTATDDISGLQSKQTQTANQITQEISDRTDGDKNTLQSSKDFTTSNITSAVSGLNSTIAQTASGILAQVETQNMVTNSEFDPLNYGWFAASASVGATVGTPWNPNATSSFLDWPAAGGSRLISYKVVTWFTSELKTGSAGKVYSGSIVSGRASAPTQSTALDLRIAFWDKNKALLATSSSGNIIDGASYKGLAKYVIENKAAPTGTLYVSLMIAHSGAADDVIGRPMLNVGSTAAPYTPTTATTSSSTILSLLKDNWSIGISDNIGNITSGIVGNASQMSLISKNVTIDSPNTQIKGTAWIQSAMIANGAIGSAQIGDATITSAKIAQLDVAKLTGNVSSFIQSNWNGLYQSVKISPIGMTISTSQGSTAQFNQDGLVLDGALGTTNVLNGQIELISSKNEYLGTFQHETMPDHDNVDYLMIKLAGWHTSKPGDSDYDLNSDSSNTIRGGDGIGFGVTNSVGTYDMKMSWDSSLVAGYKGRKAGWHVEDIMTWHQPTYFEGGFDVAQQFSSTDRRALHIQGATLSNGHKWFGFFDTPSQAGFGTDDTNDVLFYVKGKSYSLYTMLNKLSML